MNNRHPLEGRGRSRVDRGRLPAPNLSAERRGTARRATAAFLSPLVAVAGLVAFAPAASAAVTQVTPPHDIGVFPMRDFLGIGGWGVGQEMEVRVFRDGVQIGAAGPMTLAADAELDGFAEVNHPGGVCWNGTTPNLIAGDRVEAVDADGNGDFTIVQNVEVTTPATLVDADEDGQVDDIIARGTAATVDGTSRIDPSLVEQRIINPDLKDTAIGRRDVRAIFGDGLADGVETRGEITWDNPGDVTDPRWTARYFNMTEPHRNPATGALTGETSGTLAVAGQSRMLAWERTDAAANRIGMTLWEYGEVGGPGMGGCPLPADYAVNASNPKNINLATRSQANVTLSGTAYNVNTVNVTVDDRNPVTPAATAVATVNRPVNMTDTSVAMPGAQTWSATIRMADILALDSGTLVASAEFGRVTETTTEEDTDLDPATPPVPVTTRTSNPIGGETLNILKDLQAPAAPTAFPLPGRYETAQSVTISPDNDIEDIVRYRVGATAETTLEPNGSSPVAPVPYLVSSTQTVKAKSFDPAGNPSPTATLSYTIAPDTIPGAPRAVSAVAGNARATVSWTAPVDDGGSAITGWTVRVNQGTAFVRDVDVPDGAVTSAVVSGLTNGTAYNFQVRARNVIGAGAFSTASAPVTPVGTATAPAAPAIGTAVAGNASATANWSATSDGGSAITEYRVQVRTGTTVVRTVSGVAPTARSLLVTGLTNGTAYNFRVRAVNAVGVGALSAASNVVTPTASTTVPGRPVIGTAASGVAGGAVTATANWSPPASTGGSPIDGYQVRAQRVSSTGTVLGTTVSTVQAATLRTLQMTLPVAGASYRFAVRAHNAIGWSAYSANSNVVIGR